MKISDMKKIVVLLALWGGLTMMVRADDAFFDGSTLRLPELMVFEFQDETPQLLQDVELQMKTRGEFEMVQSSEFDYARVDGISSDSEIVAGDPLVVHISGFKAVDCVRLNPVSVGRFGTAFYLVVTEQPPRDNVRCTTGTQSFLIGETIDTTDLEPGVYDVFVHGLHIQVRLK